MRPLSDSRSGTHSDATQLDQTASHPPGLSQTWTVRVHSSDSQMALELRFHHFCNSNGFQRYSQVSALVFARQQAQNEPFKLALRKNLDQKNLNPRSKSLKESLKIDVCELSETGSTGEIHSQGRSIRWNLRWSPELKALSLIPSSLSRFRLIRQNSEASEIPLHISGDFQMGDSAFRLDQAPGQLVYRDESAGGLEGTWGSCSSFVDTQGRDVPFFFEGLSLRTATTGILPIPLPTVRCLYFGYQGEVFAFNRIRDNFRTRSSLSMNQWSFQAEKGPFLFKGVLRAEHRDFLGLTMEDVGGRLLFSSITDLADLEIHVYHRGKLDTTVRSKTGATFERISRTKNPYVALSN